MDSPLMVNASRQACASPVVITGPESSTVNASRVISSADSTQTVTDQAVDETERYCVICMQSISLSERSVRLSACQHVFHGDCHGFWADANVTTELRCPICRAPATRIISSRDHATRSYLHQITKQDLHRPEPLISAPMMFDVAQCQCPVLVALAFKYYPSVCARPVDAGIFPLQRLSLMTIVGDKGVGMLARDGGAVNKRALSASMGIAILPGFLLGMITSSLRQMAVELLSYLIGYPVAAQSPRHRIAIDDHDLDLDTQGYTIVLHPGVPLRSMTFWCNTFSFLSYVMAPRSADSDCWMFSNPEELDELGQRLTCINFPRKDMEWQPVVGMPDSDSGTSTCDQNTSVDAEAVRRLLRLRSGWRNHLTLDLQVSYSPDGREPFATLSDITFRSNRLSACLKYCLDMELVPDDKCRKYQQDFHAGVEALGDDRSSIYVHVSMR